jgi:signal transduction histidine kinase/DNA-binding response OmpR family regulator
MGELVDNSVDEPVEERANILIVDDLPEKLLVFGTVLEDLGQNLVFVRSGSEALREVLHKEFAVILLDVNMPDIDGFETAGLIRRYKKSAHTPIIFITAYADEMQTATGYSLGAVDYILSPVVPEMLRSKVKVFVDLYTMQQRIKRQADERVARVAAEAARRVAEDSHRRSNFLSQVSSVLSGSLDLDVGMRALLELLVPQTSAWAGLFMADEYLALGRGLAAVAPAGSAEPQLTPAQHQSLPESVRHSLQRAVRTKEQVAVPRSAVQELNAGPFGLDGALSLQSLNAVPLLVGERVLGVLVVGAEEGASRVIALDGAALDELASRAAMAFENANLYRSLQAEIVERRAAENELQYANQRKDEFLAMLSHELRNPLAPIRNALEVIRRIAPPDPKFTWASDVMDRQVEHMTRLVQELLDVARISEGKIALNREQIDLHTVISQSVETAQPFIDSRRHLLTVVTPPRPVWLQGDAARLSQIVSNLLHNAAKYSEDGSRIKLQVSVANGEALISVSDNGMGIDAALLPRIFDLFAQGSRSLDRSQGGMGVGLTLARRLAELHGGRIEAFSEGLEKGSEFKVHLPCLSIVHNQEAAPAAPVVVQAPVAVARDGKRVLIVDDNIDAGESVAAFLQLEGHEVKTVSDGMQALACVPAFSPQVVVLDIGLPHLSGYEVAKRMRLLPQTRSVLMVALTGYGQKEDRIRAMESGFDHHFVKPTNPRELVDLIATWQSAEAVSSSTAA